MAAVDLTGRTFERLTVIKRVENNKRNEAQWLCKCECGNTKIVAASRLTSGHTKSCGCLHAEKVKTNSKTHGLSKTRLFKIWCGMKKRCTNPKSNRFKNYGGRGITICEEWKNDFQAFYDWSMSHGYTDELTIDRIDVNGNYEPSNCRWVNNKVQANNRTNNKIITYNGESHTLTQWSEITGISQRKLIDRLGKLHWSVDRAFTDRV